MAVVVSMPKSARVFDAVAPFDCVALPSFVPASLRKVSRDSEVITRLLREDEPK